MRGATHRTRSARRAHARGFTLVELSIAMAAGLIVALSVVALSREASNTFHEETRIASAEMQLRTAIDRLRADLQRAAFMSTGNVSIDTNILTTPGTTTNRANISSGTYGSTTAMSFYSLAGLRLWPGASAAVIAASTTTTNLNGSTSNNLNPDALDIAGNMTSVENLQIGANTTAGAAIQNNTGCSNQGQRVFINVQANPALWRLVGMSPTGTAAAYNAALVAAFQPVAGASFIVRIVNNDTNQTQYAATCAAAAASWNTGTPYIDLASNAINLTGTVPNATINPIQIVRWQIVPSLINSPSATDPTKYDLTRQFVSAMGVTLTPAEVVAEYAVDLKFAFTIDNLGSTTGDYTTASNSQLLVNAFEESSNGTVTNTIVAGNASSSVIPYAGGVEPQRIRSVRVRLVTRSPLPDRNEPLTPTGPAAENDYLYRYCLVPGQCVAGQPVFARTRTLISEVALPNQANIWYR